MGAPNDAVEFEGHFYKFYQDPQRTWSEAKLSCEQRGGCLACVETKEQNEFVIKTFHSKWNPGWRVWIGGTSDSEGAWSWLTGDKTSFFTWLPGRPTNGKNCCLEFLTTQSTVAWDDASPNEKLGCLCEWGY